MSSGTAAAAHADVLSKLPVCPVCSRGFASNVDDDHAPICGACGCNVGRKCLVDMDDELKRWKGRKAFNLKCPACHETGAFRADKFAVNRGFCAAVELLKEVTTGTLAGVGEGQEEEDAVHVVVSSSSSHEEGMANNAVPSGATEEQEGVSDNDGDGEEEENREQCDGDGANHDNDEDEETEEEGEEEIGRGELQDHMTLSQLAAYDGKEKVTPTENTTSTVATTTPYVWSPSMSVAASAEATQENDAQEQPQQQDSPTAAATENATEKTRSAMPENNEEMQGKTSVVSVDDQQPTATTTASQQQEPNSAAAVVSPPVASLHPRALAMKLRKCNRAATESKKQQEAAALRKTNRMAVASKHQLEVMALRKPKVNVTNEQRWELKEQAMVEQLLQDRINAATKKRKQRDEEDSMDAATKSKKQSVAPNEKSTPSPVPSTEQMPDAFYPNKDKDAIFGLGSLPTALRKGSVYKQLIASMWEEYAAIIVEPKSQVAKKRSFVRERFVYHIQRKLGGRFWVYDQDEWTLLDPNDPSDLQDIEKRITQALRDEKKQCRAQVLRDLKKNHKAVPSYLCKPAVRKASATKGGKNNKSNKKGKNTKRISVKSATTSGKTKSAAASQKKSSVSRRALPLQRTAPTTILDLTTPTPTISSVPATPMQQRQGDVVKADPHEMTRNVWSEAIEQEEEHQEDEQEDHQEEEWEEEKEEETVAAGEPESTRSSHAAAAIEALIGLKFG